MSRRHADRYSHVGCLKETGEIGVTAKLLPRDLTATVGDLKLSFKLRFYNIKKLFNFKYNIMIDNSNITEKEQALEVKGKMHGFFSTVTEKVIPEVPRTEFNGTSSLSNF